MLLYHISTAKSIAKANCILLYGSSNTLFYLYQLNVEVQFLAGHFMVSVKGNVGIILFGYQYRNSIILWVESKLTDIP